MTLFGSSGIRGLVGQEITSAWRSRSEWPWARVRTDRHRKGLPDQRRHDGARVGRRGHVLRGRRHMAGMVSTPTLARAAFDYDCGLMITASHNPTEYNGVKMWNPDGSAFDTAQMERGGAPDHRTAGPRSPRGRRWARSTSIRGRGKGPYRRGHQVRWAVPMSTWWWTAAAAPRSTSAPSCCARWAAASSP